MSSGRVEELEGLKRLFDEGALTQKEFDEAKKAILAGLSGSQNEACDVSPEGREGTASMAGPTADKSKVVAGLLAIFLGMFGIHKFYLGYTDAGVTMLLVSILGSIVVMVGPVVMGTIGLIEGIIYLTRPDEQFYETYVAGRKPWF